MSKFFKSMFLLLSAGLFAATGWAVTLIDPNPTASFTDFSSIPTGTTTEAKTLTVNGVTLTLPVGVTKNDDGTVNLNGVGATVGLSTPPSSATIILDLAAAPGSGTIVSIPYKEDTGAVVSLKYDGTNLYTSWNNGGARQSGAWTAAATKVLFSNTSGDGTYAIADTVNLNDTGLHSSSKTISTIYIGSHKGTANTYMDLKIKGVYVYSGSKLTAMPTFTEVSAYERTIEGTENWTDEDWGTTGVTQPNASVPVVITTPAEATLTMNASSETLSYLEFDGEGPLTIAAEGDKQLKATTTIVNGNVKVNAGAANLGAVTLGASLTVSDVNPAPYTSLAGAGILNFDLGTDTTLTNYALNTFSGTTKISSGTLKYTAAANRPAGAILVSGENAALQIATNTDILGYSGGLPGITIENGARFEAFRRDTFSRVLTLNNGKLVFEADNQDSDRSFDLYTNSKIVSSGTSTIGGSAATNDTESGDPIVASGIIAIRRDNLEIEVADGTLNVYSTFKKEAGNGVVYKKGAGTMAVYRPATSALAVTVNAGELRLVRKGSLTTGEMTVDANAILTYVGEQTPTNTITNNGKIVADGTGTVVNLIDTPISGNGTYGVTNGGTLILKAGTENGASVTRGILKLLLSEIQFAKGYTANVANDTVVTFIKAGAEGYEDVEANGNVYTPPTKDGETISVSVGTGDGQVTAWTGIAEASFAYTNATLAIHFTANGQTFTFDNTLGVALASLTVTAEEGVTGCTIALPATEGLVSATATAINADVTVTGKGSIGEATVANTKTLTLNGPTITCAKGQGKLVKAATDELTLVIPDNNVLSTYEVNAGKLIISREGAGNGLAYSGTPSYKVSGGAHLVWHGNDLIGWTRANTVTVAEISGVLEKTFNKNETFSGRMLLKDGGEFRLSAANNWFKMYNSAIIAVEAGATAKITGNSLEMHNGTPAIDVGENATLSGETAINLAVSMKKTGAGLWTQKKAFSGGNTVTIEGGTLRIDVNKGNDAANYAQMFTEGKVISVAQGAILDLYNGYGYFATAGEGLTKVTGDFYYGISGGSATNTIATALEVTNGSTLYIRDWRVYQLTPPALRLDGAIVSENYGTTNKNFVVAPTVLSGNGTIGTNELPIALSLPENGTIDAEHGAVTVTGTVTLPAAMTVKITDAQDVNGDVALLNAADVTIPNGQVVTVMVGETAGANRYALVHDEVNDVLKLTVTEPPKVDAFTASVEDGPLSLTEALGFKALAEGATLTIDFGETSGQTFTFDNKKVLSLEKIIVQGAAGGAIVMADGAGAVTTAALTLNTTVSADAAFYATNTGAIDGTGKLCLASGELTLDEANTYAGGTDIAAGATLTITNAGALGTGAITGAGKLICDGVQPTNKTGLTTGTPADGETPASGWLGTVKLLNGNSYDDLNLASYQNANSTIEIENVTCHLSCWNNGTTTIANLCLTGEGLQLDNGTSTNGSGGTLNIGTLSGSGKFKGVSGSTKFGYKLFVTDASDFTGELDLSTTGSGRTSVVIGSATTDYNGTIVIAAPVTLDTGKTWKAVNGITVTATGAIAGTGTIGSALTLDTEATIDLTDGAFSATGTVNLPSELTVKLAAAPTVGTVMPVMKTTAFADSVGAIEDTTVTVMVNGVEDTTNTYCLQGSSTALLLDNVPAEDVTIRASNIGAAALYTTGDMGNYNSHGVQVDLDGPTPYAPGWVKGAYYPLTAFSVVSDTDGSVAAGTCVQLVATDDPTVVVATSAPFQNENKEDVTVTSSNGTNTYKLYTFKFETPVYVDAAKTYQFRFVNGEGSAVTCKLRALYTSDANGGGDSQRYCNWLNAQYEVITAVATRYAPYVVLTAERVVDNSPICRGGDETLEVTTVPEKIRLDTKTFGYGTHTVLQYTGDGTPDWSQMQVEGLPAGAEVITDGNSWGFAIKTLNVLTVGDSITAGLVTYQNSKADWHVPGGYRLPLYKYLTRAGYTVKYLGASDVFGTHSGGNNPDEANPSPSLGDNDHHEGHSGTTLNEMYDRFGEATAQQVIASQGMPDVITLHLGTNDMQHHASDTEESVGAQFAEMKKLIYRLNGVCDTSATQAWKDEIGAPLYPNATIFVAKIIPRGDEANQSKVDKFNPMLSSYVESCNSDNLILVTLPMGEGTNYGYYRHDYLHPSTEGYTQMAKGWFDEIDAAFDPFGEPAEATTPVASTATTDVTEENPATIGIRNLTSTTIGPFKAAEWTTFAEFATGYISQFGYMPESERPWQLDVRGDNEPKVENGVLSLNGAPLTVNVVDGRLGTTVGTYTAVLAVSNLAANDVIFTDAAVQCTDWPNAKGSAVADLFKMTVVNATTLKVQYNENMEQTVSLTGVDLTDATPEVLAVVVKSNACSIFVNGTKVATNVSLGTAISESYRGNFTIGALSTADTGSSMKLHRLSFYEGEVTAIAAPFATTAIINVGEGAGQYITWKTAKAGLKLADEMESLTINFTADAQNFTFDNDAAVTIDAVTVQGTAGGTIENAGNATVTATNLAINTNVTMNKCYIVDKNTLPIETTNNIAIAQNCALTYYINNAMSTVTVAATHSGAGKIVKTSYGTLEITKTCDVNVDVNAGQFKVNVPISGETKAIGNEKVVTLTGGTLDLASGLSYATINGDASSIIRVIGDYTFGISSSFTNDLDAGEIQIEAGKTLTIRNYKSGYVLSPSKLLRVNGTLQRDASNGQDFTVQISDTATLAGSGSITQAIELADGATMTYSATPLTVNTVTCAEGTLYVTGADALANGEKVTLFNTTAYADATGRIEGMTVRRSEALDESAEYLLYKTATAIEVRPALVDAETWTVDAATATTWADVIAQMEDDGKRPAATTALTIDFGDVDGDAEPGDFTFGEGDVTLGSLTVIGSNGGTITKTGTGAVTVSTAATIETAVAVEGQIQLNGLTIAEGAELAITNYAVVGSPVSGAGTLKITGATLTRGFDADLVSNTWTGTVVLEDIDDNNLDLRYLVNDSITSTDGVLTIATSSSITIEGIVKAYIYDGAIDTLTLNGTLQLRNGTTNKSKTQCVTVNTLAGAGMFKVAEGAAFCTAINVKTWAGFSGSIDIGYSADTQNTIVFLGEAPERFTTSITPGNVGADDSDFTDADYGTIYVTEGNLVTAVGSTWKAPKVNIANGTSLTIQGWFGASESITGLSANTIVGGVKNNEDEVVEAGVLDLRALDDLSGVNVTVKAGGRLLVNTGATVPNSIVFEEGAILGVATKHVEDVGNATLTVNVDGSAATTATIKGYHMDGVTELDNWAKNNETSSEGVFKFNFDPVFDGELCWWAYEFDNEVNTSPESNLGPISTGRDKGRMNFDGRGDSNRVCQDNEYVDHGDGTKAIRVASSPWRTVNGGYPTAFTAAMYGTLTPSKNRIIMGFGSSYDQQYTIVLATGSSAGEVRLLLQKGWNENNQDYPEDAVITLATTTVPNANTENHLFAFSYEQFDSNADKTLDSTRIIFYVDGEKYQPFTANAIIPLGTGFQMGSIHGGWHNSLTRMNGDDENCTMEYLRIYDQILPESVWTAMSNEYSYMSKNGRATRTIVAGQDTTWNEKTDEVGEWTQIRAVKDGEDYVLDAEGHITFDTGTAVEKPDHGENTGTQVVLNVSGENTLYLNEFYSNPIQIQNGEVSKLYYERLEINPVEGGDEDSLTLWAGRNNPDVADEYKNSQSAVITVQGYTKINTNVTMAHNVAFLSGPVSVAEGKWLHFDFSGFNVMQVPSLPVTYRLTGFLDEDTRTRVTSTAPADPVNARSIDLGYKTTVNQYTFTVNRYPVTAYFTADDDPMVVAHNNDTTINFNSLYYIWQGNEMGKQMNWEAEAVNPQGQPIVENTLAKFVSLDAETQQEKMVTVTLATNDVDPITLTLNEGALTKETTPAGTDGEGNPIDAVVENMLGAEQLIVGEKVIVNYTGDDAAELAPFVKEVSGMVKAKAMTATTWRGNLTLDNGENAVAIAGTNTVSGKLVLGKSITLATGATLSAADADFTAVKSITVDYEEAVEAGTYKVVGLEAGHTAKSLVGCVVTAVKNDASTVEWTEAEGTLVVVRADGLYVVARPDVTVTTNETTKVIKNEDLTLPLARRAAELSATSVSLTGVVNTDGKTVDASVADAAEVFTNVAFDMDEKPVDGVVTAKLKYDFGVSQINVVTIDSIQYVVAELIVSNAADLANNSADYADGVTVDVVVKKDEVTQTLTMTPVADITGAETMPATVEKAKRYIRFRMPDDRGSFQIKARAAKSAQQQ